MLTVPVDVAPRLPCEAAEAAPLIETVVASAPSTSRRLRARPLLKLIVIFLVPWNLRTAWFFELRDNT
ncbi:hypothetical protein D3C83_265320 [compost metagenome]